MVPRRDAPVVRQGDHICQVLDSRHDRCIELQLGQMETIQLVETIWPLRQTQGRGSRLLATIRGGHGQRCSGALQCQADSQGPPQTLSQPSGAGRDRQQGNSSLHQLFGGPLRLLEQHRWGPLVHVLSSTHPTRRSPRARQGPCASRSAIPHDCLSCWKHDHTDIRLEPKVFEIIDRRYGPHSVDLFATRDNRLLDRYVSWRPDTSAVAVDAFLFPLKGENLYCFPPVSCIPRLLREVLRQQVTVTLVARDWQAAWRPDLNRLLLKPLCSS